MKNKENRKAAANNIEVVTEGLKNKKKKKSGFLFLRNMKIASKILTGFLIISLLCVGLGVFSGLGLKAVSDNSKKMYGEMLLPTKTVAGISDFINQELILLRQALLSSSEIEVDGFISDIKNDQASVNQNMSSIQPMISGEKKKDYDNANKIIINFHALMDTAMANIQSGNKQKVIDDLTHYGDLRKAEAETKTAINNLQFAISGNALSMNTKNNANADMIMQIMFISVSGVLLLSILIGIVLSRGISKPLKKLTYNAKRLANGEIVNDISVKYSKDEVGQIWDAFKTILKAIGELVADTNMLIDAATKGDLSARADVEKHHGAYRKIIEGINETLDKMIMPMLESSGALKELSKGNLDVTVSGEFQGDFALVKDALNETIEALKGYIVDISYVLGEIAQGKLDICIDTEYKGDFIALKDSINASIKAFNMLLKNIDIAAQEVADRTSLLSESSMAISQGATEQASALEELTASIEEISKQTESNAERAKNSNELSMEAKQEAIIGNEKMSELQAAMQEISNSSESISKIIKVIDDIAFQTNILALNAAVEAARAGASGKGFAVVAEEVRNLAARSAQAAQGTSALIENSIKKTKAGVRITDETAGSLTKIVSRIEKAVILSGEIAGASNEQAKSIMEVNKGIEQLSLVVQTNSASSQETAASSQELSSLAGDLKEMVGKFTLQDSINDDVDGEE